VGISPVTIIGITLLSVVAEARVLTIRTTRHSPLVRGWPN